MSIIIIHTMLPIFSWFYLTNYKSLIARMYFVICVQSSMCEKYKHYRNVIQYNLRYQQLSQDDPKTRAIAIQAINTIFKEETNIIITNASIYPSLLVLFNLTNNLLSLYVLWCIFVVINYPKFCMTLKLKLLHKV